MSGVGRETRPGVGEVAALDVVAHQSERPLVVVERGQGVAEPAVQVGPDGSDAVGAGQRRVADQVVEQGQRGGWPGGHGDGDRAIEGHHR